MGFNKGLGTLGGLRLFWMKVDCPGPDECWPWLGYRDKDGYGRFGGPPRGAHRVAYELLVGPISEGMQLDHLCRNRACCNPSHLEPVTLVENWRRGQTPSRLASLQTHCEKGHPFDAANTIIKTDGHRRCRACLNAFKREWRRNRRALADIGR